MEILELICGLDEIFELLESKAAFYHEHGIDFDHEIRVGEWGVRIVFTVN